VTRWPYAVLVLSAAVFACLTTACDPAYTFTFANQTKGEITIQYAITFEGEPGVLDNETYVLSPGQTVNTGEDSALSGDRGATIFDDGYLMQVNATSDGRVVLDKVYTFDELKRLDFRIEIN
jgi:hypothetical protein